MITRQVANLAGYLDELASFEASVKYKRIPPIFRGQGNSAWELETTLDRMYGPNWNVAKYCAAAFRESHAFQAFTGSQFTHVNKKYSDVGELLATPEHAEFLVYLRHIGFPSPLLDWTKSKYIALYFAYCQVSQAQTESSGKVAVFAYDWANAPAFWDSDGRIQMFETFIGKQHRHHRQQSCYTVAHVGSDPYQAKFALYADCVKKKNQFLKIEMPMKVRDEILFELNCMNINGFSLFNSEEGLAAALARNALTREAT